MPGSTTNNGWAYPLSTDLVKDGATAMQTLATNIDTTLGKIAWQGTPYAPSIVGATGTVNYARYQTIGKTVIVNISWAISAVGGAVSFTLPVTARVQDLSVHNAHLKSGGSTTFLGWVQMTSTTSAAIGAMDASTTTLTRRSMSNLVPSTWTSGDAITLTMMYEAA